MKIEDIQELLENVPYKQKMLIIKKEFYEQYKEEIDNLVKDSWFVDLTITNMLDEKTNAVVMDREIFYGID